MESQQVSSLARTALALSPTTTRPESPDQLKKFFVALALVSALTLTGCAANASSAQQPEDSSSPTSSARPSETAPSTRSATDLASALKAQTGTITQVVTITEDNDPNKKIGRPGGYTDAAVIYDSGTTCSDGLGADCGAMIEVWPTESDAQARADYVQSALKKANGALGSEYDTVAGNYLMRVAGALKPSAADQYKKAFQATVGK